MQPPEALHKKAVHKILSIHKKTPVLKSLLNKVAFRKTWNIIKKDSNTDIFL